MTIKYKARLNHLHQTFLVEPSTYWQLVRDSCMHMKLGTCLATPGMSQYNTDLTLLAHLCHIGEPCSYVFWPRSLKSICTKERESPLTNFWGTPMLQAMLYSLLSLRKNNLQPGRLRSEVHCAPTNAKTSNQHGTATEAVCFQPVSDHESSIQAL